MSVREFLERARHLDDAINAQIAELNHLRELSMKISGSRLEERVSHRKPTEAPYAKWVERIIDKEKEINENIYRFLAVKMEISDFIDKIDNPEWQSLLRRRYVLCKSWPDIAVDMFSSLRTVQRLHNKILKNLEN
ncbi:hypothetical protein HMPREF9081_1712 [Centipeda periodontii DSM 2778]|uniref:Phage protein n=1 Tax=Centipeda periodontii DSM 2778 TaxID=888060 RepID=F5RN76_9FIRM|nr:MULTISPECIES: hypothetical protein [Selenomonadaceae]EGK59208.1 hypothetical protein HMPREF9081_1712 [Centipeda periodontii DSM 2778]EJO23511.1 hypothetical protein HMPREF1148_2029 [Selenomonas sp. FOBRC6]